jgi:cytochrome c-type biogenesis protein CcmH
LTLTILQRQSQAMAAPVETRRRLSPATLLLAVAAIAALGSIAYAALGRRGDAAADPVAKDWRTVGWAYAEKGDAAASAEAYRKAARIEPDNAENWSSLGEALQTGSRTVVPEAAQALAKAIALDPADARARYFLAVQKDLAGDHKGALAGWSGLLKDTPAGAPWEADLRRTIADTAKRNGLAAPTLATAAPATAAIPGPSEDQLAAAAAIPPGEQDKMAHAMVDRLAGRLAANPRDADGWMRLMRSRAVLNDPAGARQALASGLKSFADDSATQARLKAAAAQLGL